MLRNIQPESYHRKVKTELEDIRHHLRLLNKITQELDSLDQQIYAPQRQVTLDKSQKLKLNIRDKIKAMGLNLNQMAALLDHKINFLARQITALQKILNSQPNKQDQKSNSKIQQELKYQINQLEERIFQLQKKQNDYVKQISELKEKNAKLREEFTNLSFDSNQRIKELSEKLHNNTSPNLTIKRVALNPNPENVYLLNNDGDRKKQKNNFVKIKGGNNFQQQLNPLEMSPAEGKRSKNLLESMTSESSEYDIKGLGYELPEHEQNSLGNLKFGCFPAKHGSQKTKTGSSSQNKKMNFEQKRDKSRRFEFLLNNLVEKKSPEPEVMGSSDTSPLSYGKSMESHSKGSLYTGNYNVGGYQSKIGYQYKPITVGNEMRGGLNGENGVKRYQI